MPGSEEELIFTVKKRVEEDKFPLTIALQLGDKPVSSNSDAFGNVFNAIAKTFTDAQLPMTPPYLVN